MNGTIGDRVKISVPQIQDFYGNDGGFLGKIMTCFEWVSAYGDWRLRNIDADFGFLGRGELWVVIDFDDVISRTSAAARVRDEKLSSLLGLPLETVKKTYDESKLPGPSGEKVFRHKIFAGQLSRLTQIPEEKVLNIMSGVRARDFVEPAMLDLLKSLRLMEQRQNGFVCVSILTFGDIEYQKSRVLDAGMDSLVDEIIFTEDSKRLVLESLIAARNEHPIFSGKKNGVFFTPPLVVTLDDSPTWVDDYDKMRISRGYLNARFIPSDAKRSGLPHAANKVVVFKSEERERPAILLEKVLHNSGVLSRHLGRQLGLEDLPRHDLYKEVSVF